MRRIMLVLSLVAMLAVAAVPASAHTIFGVDDNADFLEALLEEGNFLEVLLEEDDFVAALLNNDDVVEDLLEEGITLEDLLDEDSAVFFDNDSLFGVGTSPTVGQEFEQEDVESGDVEPVVEISNAGDNANLAPTVLQSANSGNVQNAQGIVQYQSGADDIEFEGSSIEISPSVESDVTQTIEQAAAASF